MAARQRIIPIRRQYNRWVADETLEDYALRFTAKSARRWSQERVAQTAIGAISFLALEAIGGAITLSYGTANAVAAIVAASLAMLAVGSSVPSQATSARIVTAAPRSARDMGDPQPIRPASTSVSSLPTMVK